MALPYLKPTDTYPNYSKARSTVYPLLPAASSFFAALVDPYKTCCHLSALGSKIDRPLPTGFLYPCELHTPDPALADPLLALASR